MSNSANQISLTNKSISDRERVLDERLQALFFKPRIAEIVQEKRAAAAGNRSHGGDPTISGANLYAMLAHESLGLEYLQLLIKKYSEDIAPEHWVGIAALSNDHVKLILSTDSIAERILKSGWMKTITNHFPEQASFILNKYGDRLGGQKELIESDAADALDPELLPIFNDLIESNLTLHRNESRRMKWIDPSVTLPVKDATVDQKHPIDQAMHQLNDNTLGGLQPQPIIASVSTQRNDQKIVEPVGNYLIHASNIINKLNEGKHNDWVMTTESKDHITVQRKDAPNRAFTLSRDVMTTKDDDVETFKAMLVTHFTIKVPTNKSLPIIKYDETKPDLAAKWKVALDAVVLSLKLAQTISQGVKIIPVSRNLLIERKQQSNTATSSPGLGRRSSG